MQAHKNMMKRQRCGIAATMIAILIASAPTARAQQSGDVGGYILQMHDLAQQALASSRAAEEAASVADVKRRTDEVFAAVWGVPSGLVGESAQGAEYAHGWKTRWQVTFSDFDSLFAARYGSIPPEITDPVQLGIVGRGRYVRAQIETMLAAEQGAAAVGTHGPHVVASINNVIGWMKMDDGVTKGERQPRVDLTREWDSPIEFWMSTADTGWLFEVFAQASNILKTDYEGDLAAAQAHAADMTGLIEKALNGVDANGNGSVEPAKMEGGLSTALDHARLGEIVGASN